uniref:Uncharacterized protein n=1 Tax=Mus musculus TaxID=10090 RepID=Q8BPA5_MOUSE|nr:unnamed protein product [Mus musculus]
MATYPPRRLLGARPLPSDPRRDPRRSDSARRRRRRRLQQQKPASERGSPNGRNAARTPVDREKHNARLEPSRASAASRGSVRRCLVAVTEESGAWAASPGSRTQTAATPGAAAATPGAARLGSERAGERGPRGRGEAEGGVGPPTGGRAACLCLCFPRTPPPRAPPSGCPRSFPTLVRGPVRCGACGASVLPPPRCLRYLGALPQTPAARRPHLPSSEFPSAGT